jgi:hypothetical protein
LSFIRFMGQNRLFTPTFDLKLIFLVSIYSFPLLKKFVLCLRYG